MGIQPGDVLAAETDPDSDLATLSRNGFKVELDRKAVVAAEIRVEIEAVEKTIQASIADPMNLPVAGNRITAQTNPDTARALATPGGYEIQIDEHVHSTYGVTVEVETVDPSTGAIDGRIVDKSQLPAVGDQIEAQTEADSFVAIAGDGYSVQLDRFAHCETDIVVELTEIGETMHGTVAELGALPYEGQTIDLRVSQGADWAKAVEQDFNVSLSAPALVTGLATGEVTEVDGDADPTVDITGYDAELPTVGDTFEGIAHTRSDTIETEDSPYDIYIPDGIERYGRATGKIISVAPRIEGEINNIRLNKDVSSTDDDDLVGSMNDVIHNTSL